jgi:hypothetical protein
MRLSLVGRFLFENSPTQLSQVQAKNWSRDSQDYEINAPGKNSPGELFQAAGSFWPETI